MRAKIIKGKILIKLEDPDMQSWMHTRAQIISAIGSAKALGEFTPEVSCLASPQNLRKLRRMGCKLIRDDATMLAVSVMREERDVYESENEKGDIAKVSTSPAVDYKFKLPPFDHQVLGFNFLHSMKEPALFGDCGTGKSLHASTPILTPSGWVPIRDVSVGDMVFSMDGKSYPVSGVYPQGKLPLNKVELSDGISVLASDDHLWLVRDLNDENGQWIVLSTAEIRSSSAVWKLPVVDSLQFQDGGFSISARILRNFLGDGSGLGKTKDWTSLTYCTAAKVADLYPGDYKKLRCIVSIEPAGLDEAVCISVDSPSRTFVCKDFIVTHNTYIVLTFADSLISAGEKWVLLVVCPVNLIKHVWEEDSKTFTDLSCAGLRDDSSPSVLGEDWDNPDDPEMNRKERAALRKERKADGDWKKRAKDRSQDRHQKKVGEKFLKNVDIYVVNPENIRTEPKEKLIKSLLKRKIKEGYKVCLVVDESSKLKSRTSKTYRSLKRLRAFCERCIIMTGTPSPNGILDLWAQFSVLDGGKTLQSSFVDYRHEVATEQILHHVKYKDRGGKERNATKWIPKSGSAIQVYKTLKPRMIRFRTEDCIDLPPKRFLIRDVTMNEKQVSAYKDMEKMLFAEIEGEEVTAKIAATKLLKLRQITGGFIRTDEGEDIPLGKTNPKMEELDNLLEQSIADKIGDEGPPSKALIWAQYRWECKTLVKRYAKYGARGLFGGISSKAKDSAITKFKSDPSARVLVCHPGSVGHGLTLIDANYAFYYSLSYNFEEFYQSFRRITRPGQKRSMTFYFLVCPDTIDEELIEVVRAKKDLSDIITDGELSQEEFIAKRRKRKSSTIEIKWDVPDEQKNDIAPQESE